MHIYYQVLVEIEFFLIFNTSLFTSKKIRMFFIRDTLYITYNNVLILILKDIFCIFLHAEEKNTYRGKRGRNTYYSRRKMPEKLETLPIEYIRNLLHL